MAKRRAVLRLSPGTAEEREYPFIERIEVGRERPGEPASPIRIALPDPQISSRHCVVTQTQEGRFLVRDLSRNGTRVDDKRLMPNLEVEIEPGQLIAVGSFSLALRADEVVEAPHPAAYEATVVAENLAMVTLVVGDIRGYTTLNQREDPARVSQSVHAVFSQLEEIIAEHGGSLKEVQGDAVFAFWELTPGSPGERVAQAMDAALALDRRARQLAADPEIWRFPDFPLRMEFAIATGGVAISSFGKDRPIGLSMVGDTVNLAFRIEKLATDETGPILVCSTSQALAGDQFQLDELGEFEVKGREGVERLFALRGRRGGGAQG